MKQLHFENFENLSDEIVDKFDALDGHGDVAVIAKHKEVKEVFKELISMGYDICNINLEVPDWDGYVDEYILSLSHEGIWCEKFKKDTGYLTDESTVIYIMDNCSSNVIPHCKSKLVYEVSVGTDLCDADAGEVLDNDIHGFTLSKNDENDYCSISYHTTNPLTEDNIHNMLREFGFTFSK